MGPNGVKAPVHCMWGCCMSWIDLASRLSVPEIATRLELLPMPGGSLGPCPACGAQRRSVAGRRGPVGLWDGERRWRCHRCEAEGDSPDLVAWKLTGHPLRDCSPEMLEQVGSWFSGLLPALSPSKPPGGAQRPPLRELEILWSACQPVASHPPAAAWIRQRYGDARVGDPVELLDRIGLARILPAGHAWPDWWPANWQSWPLLLRLHDRTGSFVSVQGRRLGAALPRTLCPRGYQVQGTFFANGTARRLLSKDKLSDKLLIVEGFTDFIRASLIAESFPDGLAVLGGMAGSWRGLSALELSAEFPVYIATDCNDPDRTGDLYAAEISKFIGTGELWRLPLDFGRNSAETVDFDDSVKNSDDLHRMIAISKRVMLNNSFEDNATKPSLSGLSARAPTLNQLYGPAELRKDQDRHLMSLASLPAWPGATKRHSDTPVYGHGWGEHLDRLLGGGIHPGYMLALGASAAGTGKTAWLMQIVDGLALRSAELLETGRPGPLTPILVLSEMSPAALTWRSLARWTGYDSRIFRAGRSAEHLLERSDAGEVVDRAFRRGDEALRGRLGAARRFIRMMSPQSSGKALLEEAGALLEDWRKLLARKTGREIWPVLVLDPIQRWQDPAKGEVEALNVLVETLGAHAQRKGREWIVLLSSDTNKGTAAGQNNGGPLQEATAGFRGSYKLMHLVDAALYLHRTAHLAPDRRALVVETIPVKNRWGTTRGPWPHFQWSPWNGRFEAWTAEEATQSPGPGPGQPKDEL